MWGKYDKEEHETSKKNQENIRKKMKSNPL